MGGEVFYSCFEADADTPPDLHEAPHRPVIEFQGDDAVYTNAIILGTPKYTIVSTDTVCFPEMRIIESVHAIVSDVKYLVIRELSPRLASPHFTHDGIS